MLDHAMGKGIVLFDGECSLCQRSVRILKRLDWLEKLHFQSARDTEHLPVTSVILDNAKMLEEMHLLTPSRDVAYAGFRAFRWISWRIPLLMPFAPFMYLPGVPWLGNRVYLWVARNRLKLVPCHDGVCELPKKNSR
jgi:predicted DCC family thiol-disulfide oxidoreductase YuxK